MPNAPGPLTRTTAIPAGPGAVAIAAMVSFRFTNHEPRIANHGSHVAWRKNLRISSGVLQSIRRL